jgi:Flp pilus assembly pilin Flp
MENTDNHLKQPKTLVHQPSNKSRLQELLDDTKGAQLVEYIILVGVIALIALAGYKLFGDEVQAKIEEQKDSVKTINGGT